MNCLLKESTDKITNGAFTAPEQLRRIRSCRDWRVQGASTVYACVVGAKYQ